MLLRWALATAACAAAMVGCAACTGGTVGGSPFDAGTDADASRSDASTKRDAAYEADADAGLDWSWLPAQGDWRPLPNVAADCELRQAHDPEAALPPLQYKACPTQAGCEELDTDWSRNKGPKMGLVDAPIIGSRGEVFFYIPKYYPHATLRYGEFKMTTVYRLNGRGVFALAEGKPVDEEALSRCLHVAGIAASRVDVAIIENKEKRVMFGHAALGGPSVLEPLSSVPLADVGGTGLAGVTSTGAAAVLSTGSPFAMSVFGNGQLHIPRDNGTRVRLEAPRAYRGGAVGFRAIAPRVRLDFVSDTGEVRPLVVRSRHVSGFAVDHAAGQSLVWVESDTLQPASNGVIWTSPYAATSGELAPRRVTAFSPDSMGGGYMVANGGYALLVTDDHTALLVRLSDGWGWRIEADGNMLFGNALWIDDTHIFLASYRRSQNGGQVDDGGLVRIRRASLGAPTIAPF